MSNTLLLYCLFLSLYNLSLARASSLYVSIYIYIRNDGVSIDYDVSGATGHRSGSSLLLRDIALLTARMCTYVRVLRVFSI